jgi:hypothetical protein
MELSFKEIEEVFAARYGIRPPTIAFRGRLQHLQRGGFPTDVNTGKGKKATYGWRQVIQLSVALDLLDLGLTPEVAKALVLANEPRIRTACFEIERQTAPHLKEEIEDHHNFRGEGVMLFLSVNALGGMQAAVPFQIMFPNASAPVTSRCFDSPEDFGIYIDLSARLLVTMKEISKWRSAEDIAASFVHWANKQ